MPTPTRSEELVADAVGRIMAFWGFRKNLGRIWAALYLSPEPLTSAQLCDDLRLSTGSVSMALGELKRWGAIRKHYVAGDRRDHWVVEEDIWATVSRVMAQREARELAQLSDALTQAERVLDTEVGDAIRDGDGTAQERAAFRRRKVEELEELAAAGKDLLRLVTGHDDLGGLLRGSLQETTRSDAPPRRTLMPRAPTDD
ncbi:MAG: ArsR family transcriptional regulator [Deltaproteobacteria bacterium]|nr:ArsR family transcriptional regulator [Deltaproteobacteria bacterium]